MKKTKTNTNHSAKNSEDLAGLFRKTSKMMARLYHKHAHAHHAQAHLFSIIQEQGSINQGELLNILDIRSSSLSELLSKLDQADLIVRERDEEDKRGFIVSIKKGASPAFSMEKKHRGDDADFLFAALDEEEQQQLGKLLKKIILSVKDNKILGKKHGEHHRKGARKDNDTEACKSPGKNKTSHSAHGDTRKESKLK